MKHVVFIGIGSNLGERLDNCKVAVEKLKKLKTVTVSAVSNWHETKALTADGKDEHPYINGAARIITSLEPKALLETLENIELEMGRPREHAKWSPRVIDLDILFYDDLVFSSLDLTIPHPEMHKRMFVLKPMCDIEPNLVHPLIKKTIRELCGEC